MKIKLHDKFKLTLNNKKFEESSFLEKIIRALTVVGLLSLTACGDVESNNRTESTQSKPTTAIETKQHTNTIQLDLNSSPLNKQEFLGLAIPEIKQSPPCHFLSDEAAMEIVQTSWELKRRETSNESCYWSKNLGFSIKLTIEPLATAKPVRERVYNIENPPVLKDQPEPGNNALVLYDTTWDKERAYAMSFEQNNKLVMIYVTGLKTDAQRLTNAAKKVASQLSIPLVSAPHEDNLVEFNMCSIWNEAEIEAFIGTPVRSIGLSDNCQWETGADESLKKIKVGIYYGKSYPWESVINDGASVINDIGERSVMINQRKKNKTPGHALLNVLYNEKLVGISVSDTVENHKEIALSLAKNIDKRLN